MNNDIPEFLVSPLIDWAEETLNRANAENTNLLWSDGNIRVVRHISPAEGYYAVEEVSSGRELDREMYYTYSPSDCRPCWAGIVSDPARPFACLLTNLLLRRWEWRTVVEKVFVDEKYERVAE